MTESKYHNPKSINNEEEFELNYDKEIFDLIKGYFEGNSSKENKDLQDTDTDSHEKSFETSNSILSLDCFKFNQAKKKFKLSSILKDNVLLSARKLKLNLIKRMSQIFDRDFIQHNGNAGLNPNTAVKSIFINKLGHNSF